MSAGAGLPSGGISNIVEDTTPQLGGDLDLNGKNIDFPTTANISDCLDEDNMASDSATMLATQQSIKSYADLMVPLGGGTMTGNLAMDAVNISTDTTTGTQIGTGATQKLGFFGTTPVVQQATIADASTGPVAAGGETLDITSTNNALNQIIGKFNTLLAQLEALGLNANA